MDIKVICRSIEEYECKGELKYTVMFVCDNAELVVSGLLNKTFETGKSYVINVKE